jgi:serine/threonine protein kinase/HAMP domain-containing protein
MPAARRPLREIGRFQVLSRLGQGAMATVYRAHDPEIKRDLAIKVLNQQYRRDPESAARFLREARAAGGLTHPNIVTVYDVGEAQGFPYIAMELLSGVTLDKAIEARGQFAIEDAIHIGIQLGDALGYAHALGIVHRDIKPSNIVLGEDGRTVKLLDFGIARVAEGGASDETLKTQAGQILGTPRYMSPEQALGRPLDGRSDLFSVGAILYELIAGKPAFDGASIATLALQITTQQPPPICVIPACPSGLRFILDRLLSKQPDKRFADGAELVAALRREAAAWNVETRDEKARRIPLHMRFALMVSGVVAAVLAVGIGWVHDQQYRAMESVAIASGSSIATFVANNTALYAMENDSRPPAEADWLPVQAFVNTAAADPSIAGMIVADRRGIVQASANRDLIGKRYNSPAAQVVVGPSVAVSASGVRTLHSREAFTFVAPILYADRWVGTVAIDLRKDDLLAAAAWTRTLLIGFGVTMMAVALGLSLLAGRIVLSPLRRLNAALREAAEGRLDFRISHRRRDEFGELFDSFNTLAGNVEAKLDRTSTTQLETAASLLRSVAPGLPQETEALDATQVRVAATLGHKVS